MHPHQIDIIALKSLLGQSEQAPAEVGQRLQWFIHFAECGSVSDTCRMFGIARTTFYRWMKRFDPQDLRSLQDASWSMPARHEAAGDAPQTLQADRLSQPIAAVFAHKEEGAPCPLCRLKSFNWTSLRSAAFVTSIVFNLALAGLIIFTAMLEGQSTKAATPATVLPAEQHETSLLNSILGIDIANAATGIYKPINYQGKLTNTGGIAIANGNYDMRFRIYGAASGGVPLWSEVWNSGNQKVTATGGLFSIALGTHTAMTGSVDFNSDSLFLQVEFDPGADGVFEEVFTPRRRFASVPYALNSDSLDGLNSTQFIRSDISYTSSGTLTISPRNATRIGIDILSTAGNTATGALRLSTQGANHIIFGSGGLNYDTNLYRSAAASLKTNGNFSAVGTLSGKTLVVSGNASITGSLVVNRSISGATLEILGTASGKDLFATRSISGTYLYAASTFGGAGLASCSSATTSKLLYNIATKQFSCGTDQTGGSAGTSSFSGSVIVIGDARYVKKAGDTMTGALIINVTGGNQSTLGLRVLNTISGAVLHAEKSLSSSGTLAVRGNAYFGGTVLDTPSTFSLGDNDNAGGQIVIGVGTIGLRPSSLNADTLSIGVGGATVTGGVGGNGAIFIANRTDTSNQYNIGEFKNNGTLKSAVSMGGSGFYAGTLGVGMNGFAEQGVALEVLGTASGTNIFAAKSISGTYLYAASTFGGAGLASCSNATTSKLLYNSATKQFSCGTDQTGGSAGTSSFSGGVLRLGDARYVKKAGDTMTGALVINITGGNQSTLGLNVLNTISGSVIRAQNALASSGTLVVRKNSGTNTGNTVVIDTQGLVYDASNKRVGIGTASPSAALHIADNSARLLLGAPTASYGGISFDTTLTTTNAALLGQAGTTQIGVGNGGTIYARIGNNPVTGELAMTTSKLTYVNGKFGIGTTVPGSKFAVSGTVILGANNNMNAVQAQTGVILEVLGTASGSDFYATKSVSGANLFAAKSISGTYLYAASTFGGAGLGSCSNATTSKLLYNSATKQFSCGTDQTGGSAGTASFSGSVLVLGDARYVKKSGDTMTGALIINITGGNQSTLGLRVLNTISGAVIRAQNTLGSSGTLVVKKYSGTNTGNTVIIDTQGLVYDASNKRVGIGTAAPKAVLDVVGTISGSRLTISGNGSFSGALIAVGNITTRGVLSGKTLIVSGNASVTGSLVVNKSISGASLEILGTASGRDLFASKSISGTYLYAASTFGGAGLGSCSNAVTSKLLYNIATKQFSCGTDQNAIEVGTTSFSGAVLRLGDARYVKKSGDTMTGALIINITGGNDSTLGLRVLNTISGSVIHAEKALTSSGILTVVGTGSFKGNVLIGDAAADTVNVQSNRWTFQNNTSFVLNNSINALAIDSTTFSVDALNHRIGIGTAAPETTLEVVGTMSGQRLAVYSATAVGTGAAYIQQRANGTGVLIKSYATTNPVLALDGQRSGTGTRLAPHILFGYRGTFDTRLYRYTGSVLMMNATLLPETTKTYDLGSTTYRWRDLYLSGGTIAMGETGDEGKIRYNITTDTFNLDAGADNVAELSVLASGRVGIGTTTPKATLDVMGTISGKTLTVSGNGSFSGSLVVAKSISGATLEILGTASGKDLFATKSISGTYLFAASTFGGAGLASCSNATTSKLLYNIVTKQFSCGTDQTGGGGVAGTASFSGAVLTIGDARYVKKAGDTMTGALVINITGGNQSTLGLRVLNTISGAVIRAQNTLASSGTLVVRKNSGTNTGNTVVIDTQGLVYDASNKRVGIGTAAPKAMLDVVGTISGKTLTISGNGSFSGALTTVGNITTRNTLSGRVLTISGNASVSGALVAVGNITTRGVLSGKTLIVSGNASVTGSLVVNKSISGAALEILGTASGKDLFATRSISGTYLYAASTFGGAGLGSCSNATTSKLLYNIATKQFSCGTDQTGAGAAGTASFSGAVLTIGDARYVKKAGDTMTGALVINVTGGNDRTIGLKVLNTISGSYVRADKQLVSSGTLVVESGAFIGGNVLVVRSNNNRVGINNFAATQALDVNGNITIANTSTYQAKTTGGVDASILWLDTSDNLNLNASIGSVLFKVAGSEKARVDNGGNFGIGTTTPGSKLSVSGAVLINPNGNIGSTTADAGLALEIIGTASGKDLFATRSISGTYLYAASTFGGAGLASCSNASTSKLLYNSATKQFSCGTDQSGGSAGTSSFSGSVLRLADARYVKKSGDTMTGALTINVTGGNLNTIGLKVLNTFSGALVHAENQLTSSGGEVIAGRDVNKAVSILRGVASQVGNLQEWQTSLGTVVAYVNANGTASFASIYTLSTYGTTKLGTDGSSVMIGNSNTPKALLDVAGTISGKTLVISGNGSFSGALIAVGNITTRGVLSGKTLIVSGNASVTGSLVVNKSISGAALEILGTASGKDLFATRSISGTYLYAASTFGGAGLGSCSNATTSKLLYNSATKQFSCGTDQTGGSGVSGTSSFSGAVLTIGDARYVKKSGDTMTGALVINVTGGTPSTIGLKLINTLSGANVHAETSLSSSGNVIAEGMLISQGGSVGLSVRNGGAQNRIYTNLNGDNGELMLANSSSTDIVKLSANGVSYLNGGNVGIGTTTPTATLEVQGTISGTTLQILGTASGQNLFATKSISGTYLYAATTFGGAGLVSCSNAVSSKLLYNSATKQFTCGTDQSGSSGISQSVADERYVKKQGDTMTGALIINVTGGNANTLGLKVLNYLSGATIHAEKMLTASGMLVTESGAIIDAGTLYVDAGNNRVGIGTLSPTAILSVNSPGGAVTMNNPTAGNGVILAGSGGGVGGQLRIVSNGGAWADAKPTAYFQMRTARSDNTLYNNNVTFMGGTYGADTIMDRLQFDSAFTSVTDTAYGSTPVPTSLFELINSTANKGLLKLKAAASQTANLTEWQNSAGTVLASVDKSGSGFLAALGVGTASPKTKLDVVGTISGKTLTISGNGSFSGAVFAVGNITTRGVLSGKTLVVSGNASVTGSLVVNKSISGASLEILGTASGKDLFATRSVSGTYLYAASTFGGAGLASCSSALTSKLLYNSATKQFSCGTDQTGGSGVFGSGNVLTIGDARYVKKSGDTMTGALVINVTGGNASTIGLRLINALSGATIHAEKSLSSSGTLVVVGTGSFKNTLSGAKLYVSSYIDFAPNLANSPNYLEGRVFYDSVNKTLAYYTDTNGVTMNLGQEQWLRVRNTYGSTITNGQAVYINGSYTTGFPTVAPGKSNNEYSSLIVGIATQDITNNTFGYVTTQGVVHGLNTVAYATGATLYLSSTTSGALVTTKPNDPNLAIVVGYVVKSNPTTGAIYVVPSSIDNGKFTSGAVNFADTTGDNITSDATNFLWDNTNKRLGIGTASPKAKLDVAGTISGKTLTISGNGSFSGALIAVGNITTRGVLSGKTLVVSGNASVTGSLVVNRSISGATLEILGTASGKDLFATRSVSGTYLYAASTFGGAGLGSCSNATTSKLLYNSATKQFSCGTDQNAIEIGTTSFSGAVLRLSDARYVKKSGDTMTGALVINVTGGNDATLGLRVLNTISGSVIHAEKALTSSGTLTVVGNGTVKGTLSGRVLTISGNASVSGALVSVGNITTRGVLSGKTLIVSGNASVTGSLVVKKNISGAALEILGTASGGDLFASRSVTGTNLFAVNTFNGAGLTDCSTAATSKLLWSVATKKFSCGTDQTGGAGSAPEVGTVTFSGGVLRLSDARYVKKSGDTMTGALVINITGGNQATLGLRVLNTISGAVIRAQNTLGSSGTLVVKKYSGTNTGNTVIIDTQGFVYDASNKRVGIGTAAPKAVLDVVGTISGSRLTISGNGSFSGAVIVVGNITTRGVLSGKTLIVSGNASVTGSLVVRKSISGASLEILGTISGTTVVASGTGGTRPLIFASAPWNAVGIGTNTPTQRLTVSGGTILNVAGGNVKSLSGVNIGAQVNDIAVVGRYAYVASGNSPNFRILDIGNPLNPRTVSSLNFSYSAQAVVVSGKYAYLATTTTTNEGLRVIDISNPSLPVEVASTNLIPGNTSVQALAIYGKTLYIGKAVDFSGPEFLVADIANPYAPKLIGSIDMGSSVGINSIAIQGKYAYLGMDDDGFTANEFRVIDISSPVIPVDKGGLSLGAAVKSIVVTGPYAYVGLSSVSGNDFRIFDITNPTSVSTVGGLDVGTDVLSVDVAGRYAYLGLTSAAGNDFRVVNISNPALPGMVGGADLSNTGRKVLIAGKYAYIGFPDTSGVDLAIYDINGIDAPSASIGSMGVDILYVGRSATIANSLSVIGGINVGVGGIRSDGMLSISVGSGSGLGSMTGAIIQNRGMTGTVLALDSWRGNGTGNKILPHLLFGYRGTFDTMLYRAGSGVLANSGTMLLRGGTGRTLLKIESGLTSSAGANIVEVFSNAVTGFGNPNHNRVLRVDAAGGVFSDGSFSGGGADYAERFLSSTPNLKAGQLVCLDPLHSNTVKLCDRSGDPNVMGIVSTKPAFVGDKYRGGDADGKSDKDSTIVGLIGQLPAKAIVEDGQAITVGDALAAAAKPGFVRKAKAGESTVGVALSPLASGEGSIDVLITRRNQSDLVEKIENEVTQSIADMHIEDDVRTMVQTAMNGANINGSVAAAVQAQVQSLNLAAEINTILNQRLSDGSLNLGSNGTLSTDIFAALQSHSGSLSVQNAVAERLGLSRSGTSALTISSDLFTSGALTVQQDVMIGGTLHAAAIQGPIRFDGPILPGSNFALGAIHLTGSTVQIGSITASGALKVLGDVTISGLATFLGQVDVKGELIVSSNQAGFAIIPAHTKAVTVTFGTGFVSTPVVNATPNGRVGSEWWIDAQSQTGFVIRTDKSVSHDIRFSWTALGVRTAHTSSGQAGAVSLIPFHTDAAGTPYSITDNIWNACIRDPNSLDACRGYHQGSQWFFHPDIVAGNQEVLSFTYDAAAGPDSLVIPSSYETQVVEQVTSSSSSAPASSASSTSSEAASSESASATSSSASSESASSASSVSSEASSSSSSSEQF